MSNMSYCRFHNTKLDLEDCAEHILDDDLSEDEFDARKRLIRLCHQIVLDCFDEEGEPMGDWNKDFKEQKEVM